MVDTFTWKTQEVGDADYSYNNRTVQYGDGYKQTTGNGINTENQSWPLTFTGSKASMMLIVNFLRAHKGTAAFLWYNPLGELGLYTFDKFTVKPVSSDVLRVNVTFMISYTP